MAAAFGRVPRFSGKKLMLQPGCGSEGVFVLCAAHPPPTGDIRLCGTRTADGAALHREGRHIQLGGQYLYAAMISAQTNACT